MSRLLANKSLSAADAQANSLQRPAVGLVSTCVYILQSFAQHLSQSCSLNRRHLQGGSALAMNLQAVQATVVTMIAASMGGLTWMSIDAFKTKRWSTISFCSGIIAGLVGCVRARCTVGD